MIFPNLKITPCCEKYLKNDNTIPPNLTLKAYWDISCPWTFSDLEAHSLHFSFPYSLLLGTVNVRGQISENVLTPNGGY